MLFLYSLGDVVVLLVEENASLSKPSVEKSSRSAVTAESDSNAVTSSAASASADNGLPNVASAPQVPKPKFRYLLVLLMLFSLAET